MKKLTLFTFCITISLCAAYSQKAIIQVIPDTTKTVILKFAYNPFRWSEFNQDAITKIDIGTTPTKIVYYLDKPQVQSASFGSINSQIMYITPEDSVVCRIKNVDKNISKFIFTGKNAAHYDFYTKMGEKVLQKDCPQYMKSEDLMAFKERLKKYWMLKTDFLDSYIKGNTVSDAFVDWIKSELQNEYVLYLYQPIGDKSVLGKDIPATYFEKLSLNPLSRYYKSALAYKNIYCLGQNGTADISNISENIKKNYTGDDRAFLWSAMIGYFAQQQQPEYKSELLSAIKAAPEFVKDSSYLSYIHRAEEYYTMLNQPFPADVLNNTFLKTLSGEKISLNDVLNQNKGKAIYLDFWASWCGPCRYDIKNSDDARKYLKEKDVVWICLSLDKKEDEWMKAVKEENLQENQYLILSSDSSPILKYLSVNYIPRYSLLDSKHKVAEAKAVRPCNNIVGEDTNAFALFKTCIQKVTTKVVRFF